MKHENSLGQMPFNPQAWTEEIPDEQWSVYQRILKSARTHSLRFALGGAFAVANYTGRWRNTKDLDFYVHPQDKDKLIEIVTAAGMQDYYDQLPYQRHWIYRAIQDDTIVDIIWAMANGRAQVDERWLRFGPQVQVRGEQVHLVPAEELIWAKLYVMQRERCDWPDILNIIHATAETLDWGHLVTRLDQDVPLLEGLLVVFSWLSTGRTQALPLWLLTRLSLDDSQLNFSADRTRSRACLLDNRPWFIPAIPADEEPGVS